MHNEELLCAIISILEKYLYRTEKGMEGNTPIFEHGGEEQYVIGSRVEENRVGGGGEEEPGTREPSYTQ